MQRLLRAAGAGVQAAPVTRRPVIATPTAPDAAAILRELDAHRERYIAFCKSLSAEELARPVPKSTWLVRDFIAHLGTIDRSVVNWFRAIQQGNSGRPATSSGERFDVDRWNDAQVAERRDWTLDRVFDEMAANRAEIRDVIASFTEDDLNRTISFGGDSKRAASEITLIQYLRGWCKHDVMHAYDMARALPGRITPEIERWFDDPAVVGYQKSMNRDD